MLFLKKNAALVKLSSDLIMSFPLTDTWDTLEGIIEKVATTTGMFGNFYMREVFAIGKMADDEHIVLICGKHVDLTSLSIPKNQRQAIPDRWHMYVNGVLVWRMTSEDGHAFSSVDINPTQAMKFAETYIKSDKMRFGIKFDREMSSILKQYQEKNQLC
jgi:hypothetical protein